MVDDRHGRRHFRFLRQVPLDLAFGASDRRLEPVQHVADRHCQTNWMGPVEPTIEGSQTASWRHSAKAVERLSLKLPRL